MAGINDMTMRVELDDAVKSLMSTRVYKCLASSCKHHSSDGKWDCTLKRVGIGIGGKCASFKESKDAKD